MPSASGLELRSAALADACDVFPALSLTLSFRSVTLARKMRHSGYSLSLPARQHVSQAGHRLILFRRPRSDGSGEGQIGGFQVLRTSVVAEC